jgi:endonuclease/exonuclease/phosphatase family metal-dependent hydrolase
MSFSRSCVLLLAVITLPLFGTEPTPDSAPSGPRIEAPQEHSVPGYETPTPGPTLRIATWNIEWFPAGMRKSAPEQVRLQTEAVRDLIHEFKPDILATQETRNLGALIVLNKALDRHRFGHLASARFQEENTARIDESKATQNTGFLSRFPWTRVWEVDFSTLPPENRPARGLLGARFEIKGLVFHLYNTHTKSNFGTKDEAGRLRNYSRRLATIHELKRDWDRLGLDPAKDRIIVAGDFNTDLFSDDFSGEQTLRLLLEWGFRHPFGNRPLAERITLPGREGEPYPDGTFDYLFFSPAFGDEIPPARIIMKGASKRKDVFGGDEPGLASDHYPVYVDLPLP